MTKGIDCMSEEAVSEKTVTVAAQHDEIEMFLLHCHKEFLRRITEAEESTHTEALCPKTIRQSLNVCTV